MDNNSIRPANKITPEVLHKLEDAFTFAFNDEEAALYAGISPRTLYYYQNLHPKFVQRKEQLRKTPNMAAKKELVKAINGNVEQSRWWAKNKMSDEFGPKTKVAHEGKIETVNTNENQGEIKELIVELRDKMFAIFTAPKESQGTVVNKNLSPAQ
jgi:hypothetical protein